MKMFDKNVFAKFNAKFVMLFLVSSFAFASCNMNAPVPVTEDNTNTRQMQRRSKPAQPVGAAEMGWTLIDDKRKKLSDYKGKVVILDMWATYCPPCVEGTPHLVKLQNQYGKDGLVVIGLNVGNEDKKLISDFAKQFNVQYEMAIPDWELVDLYTQNDSRIPQTFILDREGRTVRQFVGFNRDIGAAMEEIVKQTVKE